MITAVFFVRRTASGLTVRAEFTGQGPKGRRHTQTKQFRDSYGCAMSKLQDWIRDWHNGCEAAGIQAQHTIEFQP